MAYTLSTLLTEFYARGFSYLNDGGTGATRATRWINDAMHSIDGEERWDYRRASTSGTPPLTISDLGELDSVVDTTNQNALAPSSAGDLVGLANNVLTGTGNPNYFYLNAGVVTVYPVATGSITVSYFKVRADLSSGADAPLMPDRFRPAIVERALEFAYRDQDNPEMARECAAAADRMIDRMRLFYILQPGGQRQVIHGYYSQDW